MNPLDDSLLKAILSNDGNKLFATESETIEYKSDFDWSSKEKRAKYSKSFAAFSNNGGGYVFFGVDDKSQRILGITDFDTIDSANIADHLNNYFTPSISFHKRTIAIAGKTLGVIYIERYKDVPTVCIKAFETILRDGALYYRYPGKSDNISGTDLIHLLHNIKGGDTKELIELKKTELKQGAKPNFILNGAGSSQNTFDLRFKNVGKRAKIISVKSKTPNINIWGTKENAWIEEGGLLQIEAANSDGMPSSFSVYEIEMCFEDSLGTCYSSVISGKGTKAILSDPIEKHND